MHSNIRMTTKYLPITQTTTHELEFMASDRDSWTSQESGDNVYGPGSYVPRRWPTLESAGRCLFLFSLAFFIVGVLVTVFGFSGVGLDPAQRLPLQILGPACLFATGVMWVVGCIFSRLWQLEWKRHRQALELRDRVQMHALASDALRRGGSPSVSPSVMKDPFMRRQLLLKMKAQRTMELNASAGPSSRRSSKATSVDSRRIKTSTSVLEHSDTDRRSFVGSGVGGACGSAHGGCASQSDFTKQQRTFALPGIQISRFDTMDGTSMLGSAASARSSPRNGNNRRYIVVHENNAGTGGGKDGTAGNSMFAGADFVRLSCPSDYSLSRRSSRSRSSCGSSRMFDFSPRDSEWDADVSVGSRESQLSLPKQDWCGGPADYLMDDYYESGASGRGEPGRLSVTFDLGSPCFRRHSSPSYPMRRDSSCECTCPDNPPPSTYRKRLSEDLRLPPSAIRGARRPVNELMRKSTIEENEDGDSEGEDTQASSMVTLNTAGAGGAGERRTSSAEVGTTTERTVSMSSVGYEVFAAGARERRDRMRRSLKRNNTDDSEVERRVARLFNEIEFSVNESVDETKIRQSVSSEDKEMHSNHGQSSKMTSSSQLQQEVREVQVQTMNGEELQQHLLSQGIAGAAGNASDNNSTDAEKEASRERVASGKRPPSSRSPAVASRQHSLTRSLSGSMTCISCAVHRQQAQQPTPRCALPVKPAKRSRLATITNALANFGRQHVPAAVSDKAMCLQPLAPLPPPEDKRRSTASSCACSESSFTHSVHSRTSAPTGGVPTKSSLKSNSSSRKSREREAERENQSNAAALLMEQERNKRAQHQQQQQQQQQQLQRHSLSAASAMAMLSVNQPKHSTSGRDERGRRLSLNIIDTFDQQQAYDYQQQSDYRPSKRGHYRRLPRSADCSPTVGESPTSKLAPR